MGLASWNWVDLKGSIHVIPSVCPNCLRPAEVELSYKYVGAVAAVIYPFSGPEQSFFYCAPCSETARAGIRADRMRRVVSWMLTLIVLSLVVGPGVLFPLSKLGPLRTEWMRAMEATHQWVLLVWPLSTVIAAWAIVHFYGRRQRRRFPQREGQAVWGLAAFYTGAGTYRAACADWIRALVRANPTVVDDDVYREATGEEKPSEK